jgi:SAM-dependent methyltransferase
LGCGVGIDIDILTDLGYDIIGIEIGNRTKAWKDRKYPERLILANGMHMPFPAETFDAIYCGCVFPHVGVVGDSFTVKQDYFDIRLSLAKEMTRVLKPGGMMLVSSPNGKAPLDLFHDRKVGSYKPRYNPPGDPCIPSIDDYKKLFVESVCANKEVTALPVRNYWGFIRAKQTIKGYFLSLPVRFLFWLSSYVPLLRGSFIDPWLVIKIQK